MIRTFGLMIGFIFTLFLLLYRLVLPFGDEPDFVVRSHELLYGDFPMWSPYFWMKSSYDFFNTDSNCNIHSSVLSFWASIDPISCSEDMGQIFGRILLTMVVVSPILAMLIFHRTSVRIVKVVCGISSFDADARLTAMGFALLVPGMIYYLSLLSPEALTLSLSLMIFIFWNNLAVVLGVIWLIASIDFGNAFVVLLFVFYLSVTEKFFRRFGLKKTIALFFLVVISSYLVGEKILFWMQGAPFVSNKALALLEVFEEFNFSEKYPVFLRPVVTFMTAVFMTPSGVKVIAIYILYIFLVGLAIGRLIKINLKRRSGTLGYHKYIKLDRSDTATISMMCAISFIFSIDYILPNYANAKYFIFLMPFLIKPMLRVISRDTFLAFSVLSASIVFLQLLIFRA